jgi:UDP-3-O-[3-hydroxymyristoyl] glucosamine N-acyltransferase
VRHKRLINLTAAELASFLGGVLEGSGETVVAGVASIDDAVESDVVFAEDIKFFQKAVASPAGCIIACPNIGESPANKSVIRVPDAVRAFVEVLRLFAEPEAVPSSGIGPGAVVASDAEIGYGVAVGANCYIGKAAKVGDRCVLFPNVYVGDGVQIGEDSVLHPGVVIYQGCKLGRRVVLHAGVVIGSDGFGYATRSEGLLKFPHIGTVEIGDDVEIGANSTVDRAKTGATIIGKGTKIDNLVHIAHNVRIGANCVIVALSGIAGSVEIGDWVTIAAQAGVKDHVRIGDRCVVAARAGVIGNLPDGSVVSGFPARDHATEKKVEAARLHLPDILRRLRVLEHEIEKLRAKGFVQENDDADH